MVGLGLVTLIVLSISSKKKNPKTKQKFPVFPVALLVLSVLVLAYTFRRMGTCSDSSCEFAAFFYGGLAAIGLVILALVVAIFNKFFLKD